MGGQYQVVLKEIDLPVVSNYECQDKLRSTRLGQKYKLHDSFICAGGVNGKDTCKGDGCEGAASERYLRLPAYWALCEARSYSQVHPYACPVRCPHVHGGQHPEWDAVH